MPKILLFILLFSIIGCQKNLLQINTLNAHEYKGKNLIEIKKTMGTPDQIITQKEKTTLIYVTNYTTFSPPTAAPLQENQNTSVTNSFSPTKCQTIIEAEKNIITKIKFKGNCL